MKRPRKSKKRVCKKQCITEHQEQKEWWEREEGAKWVTHYCSDHQILLVGDGDFSFSLSLAKAFGSASNMVASSLDTYAEVIKKYRNAKSNLEELRKLGAYLLHGVDATQMKFHPDLKMRRFDRIIFNFPHAGFHRKEVNLIMIKMHMDLVYGFFKNATHMLRVNGEVHVNHKTTPPFNTWNIERLAEQCFLIMIECADFKQEDYPGYNNKRGHSYRCDNPFPLGKCSTFKFIYNPRSMKDHLRRNHMEASRQQMTNIPYQEIQNMEHFPAPDDLNYHPRTSFVQNPNQLDYYPRTSIFPKTDQLNHYPQTSLFPNRNEPMRSEFDLRNGYNTISNNVSEIHGRVDSSADYYRYARDIPSYNQPLQQCPTPTNCRFCVTESYRRTMDVAPSIMPVGARIESYHQYQVFERSSTYLQEELYRNAQRPSYCSDIARHDLERYNAEVPRRDFNRDIYVMQ